MLCGGVGSNSVQINLKDAVFVMHTVIPLSSSSILNTFGKRTKRPDYGGGAVGTGLIRKVC